MADQNISKLMSFPHRRQWLPKVTFEKTINKQLAMASYITAKILEFPSTAFLQYRAEFPIEFPYNY